MSSRATKRWWRTAAVYEIYVRSFMDSNGDGVGDLNGIRARLDHLKWLGIDALWLTPFYPSPMADFGYDVADYTNVDPIYGTLGDFDALLAEAHRGGMRLVLDLVPNHTSDRHPWFLEARSSRESLRRDWYVWRDPRPGGGPPNNWLSTYGDIAWTFDEATGQYYYHAFLKEQPDLNWRNPEVRAAMCDVMRFWLDRGVDGFRVDAVDYLLEDERLRGDPPSPRFTPDLPPAKRLSPVYSQNQPETRDLCRELGRVVRGYGDRVLIGEVHVPAGQLVSYYGGAGSTGLDLPFNFALMTTPWRSADLREAIDSYVAKLSKSDWPNWVLGNHDETRVATRVGHAQARVAAMLLLTLRGTPTLYYGDELGMRDVPIPRGRELDPQGRLLGAYGLNRDPGRAPMPWDGSPGGGFTAGTPWLPLPEDRDEVNVERQRNDPTSTLTLYRRLLSLRREEPALRDGEYAPVDSPDGTVAFTRTRGAKTVLIALEVGGTARSWRLPAETSRGRVLLSTSLDREEEVDGELKLRANEGVIIALGRSKTARERKS